VQSRFQPGLVPELEGVFDVSQAVNESPSLKSINHDAAAQNSIEESPIKPTIVQPLSVEEAINVSHSAAITNQATDEDSSLAPGEPVSTSERQVKSDPEISELPKLSNILPEMTKEVETPLTDSMPVVEPMVITERADTSTTKFVKTQAPTAPQTPKALLPRNSTTPINAQRLAQSVTPQSETTNEVHVHIGRIEVTALPEPAAPIQKPKPKRGQQPMSLDSYLARRGSKQ
jgi:hypothetical protein